MQKTERTIGRIAAGLIIILLVLVFISAFWTYSLNEERQSVNSTAVLVNATGLVQSSYATALANTATAQADLATGQADMAILQAATATIQAQVDATQVDNASVLASTATFQASVATIQAATGTPQAISATSQAETAMRQAEYATAYANTATMQASTAADQATRAANHVQTATAQAKVSGTQAAAATFQAGTATPQAVLATIQAATATSQVMAATSVAATATPLSILINQQAGTASSQARTATAQAATATAQMATATAQIATATAQALEQARRVIRTINYLPTAQPVNSSKVVGTRVRETNYGIGMVMICSTKDVNIADNFKTVELLSANANELWPGAIIRGSSLTRGVLAGIPFERASGTIVITGLPGSRTKVIESPSFSTVNAAIEELLPEGPTPPTANMVYNIAEVHSLNDLMIKAGILFNSEKHDLNLGFGLGWTNDRSHVMIQFRQTYYTVTFTRPVQRDPMTFFRSVRLDTIGDYMGTGDPPMYVESVDYGRELTMVVGSSRDGPDLTAAIDYMYRGAIGGYAEAYLKNVLQEANIQLVAHGGSSEDIANIIAADFRNPDIKGSWREYVGKYFVSGSQVSQASRGAPLSFRVNYLKDDTPALIAYNANYQSSDCTPESTIDPTQFIVYLDTMRVNSVDSGIPFVDFVDLCFDFGIGSTPFKRVSCGSPLAIRNGNTFTFTDHSPLFQVPTKNGSCFTVSAQISRRLLVATPSLGEGRDTICYNDGKWLPGIGPRAIKIRAGGIDVDLFYTVRIP